MYVSCSFCESLSSNLHYALKTETRIIPRLCSEGCQKPETGKSAKYKQYGRRGIYMDLWEIYPGHPVA